MSRTPFSARRPQRGGTFRPQLEVLEDRLAPSSLSGGQGPALPNPGDGQPDLAFLAGIQAGQSQQAAVQTTSDVLSVADGSVQGSSVLTRTDGGVSIRVTASGLPAGAYSFWWVVINPGTTAEDRIVGRAGGHVVGEEGNGTFAAHLNEGEVLLGHPRSGGSLQDARAAEIRLVVRYHGPVEPGRVFEQTHTFELGVATDWLITTHRAP